MSQKTNPLTRGKKQKALVLLQHNQPAEAKPLLEHVCRADPRDAEAWFLLGATCQDLGNFMQADSAYRQVITLRPDFLEAWCNLGSVLELRECPVEALDCYRRALQINPDMPELQYNVGNVLQTLGRHEEAEQSYREAVRLRPAYVEAHDHLGVVAAKQDRHDEAIAHYRRALAIRPDYATSHYNLAVSLKQLGRQDEAIESYRRALAINPRDTEALVNLGIVLAERREFDEAIAYYREALRLKPDDAEAHSNLGNALRGLGRLDEAIASYRRAIAISPEYADAHFNLAVVLLLHDDFRHGWQEYQQRWERAISAGRSLPPSPWDGSNLNGKNVFLHTEQGLGDEFFFLRFVPWLKQRGAGKVTYRSDPRIASLLSRVKEIDRIAAPDEQPAAGEFVFAVGDLPWLLGMERADQIPPSLVLTPLPQQLESLKTQLAQLGPPPYVGVTWRAGTSAKRGSLYKESPRGHLAEILRNIPATVLILQRNPLPGEIEAFASVLGRPAHDFSELNRNLEEMLALLAQIDEYVGVSNTNMHLRAGTGRTARVLVPSPPEWRWMAEGRESPWFPGFNVYRQGYDGSWGVAFRELVMDLVRTTGMRG